MLVIISDVHLTDGTAGLTINHQSERANSERAARTLNDGAFRVFRERLSDMAYDASWRKDGKYRPIEQMDLLLLGDILDVIRSSAWLASDVRPWDDPRSEEFVNKVGSITEAILQNNCKSLKILATLAHGRAITIPPATRSGTPAKVSRQPKDPERLPVKVLNRFPVEVKKRLGDELSDECLEGLNEIDNVRPLPILPLWVAGLLQRTCLKKGLASEVKKIWDSCAQQFLDLKFVRDHDNSFNPFQNVDKLQAMLMFSTMSLSGIR